MAKDDKKKGQVKEKKPSKKLHELYNVSGDKAERKNRTCPKCGPGMFLGVHKDRLVCGSCKYVEMKGSDKKEEVSKEEAKPEENKGEPVEETKEAPKEEPAAEEEKKEE